VFFVTHKAFLFHFTFICCRYTGAEVMYLL